tara:strand:- start:4461 stop:5831 length:1371 start_codon:yes stop_codon:yes gene_type:complete
MSKYRQTMSEALTQVHANEDASYLAPRLNPQQIANIKKVFMKKKASDITPSIKAMIKKMDIPTQLAIKQADIPHLSKLVEEETDLQEAGLSAQQIAILKKEYEPMRGKTITAARAKQLMNILDKFKEQDLQKLSKANIPFVSSGSDTKLRMRKMKFKVTTFNPMGSFKENIELDEENFNEACWTGYKQVGFKDKGGKKVPNCVPEDYQWVEEGRMKDIFTANQEGESAKEIAKRLKLPLSTVKKVLGEDVDENAPSTADIDRLKKMGMKPRKEELEEKIQPFMISYSKYGKHAGFEGGDSLQDIQNKAQKLRAKGFTIDKMGRYNPPVKMKAGYGESVDNYPTSDINKKKHAAYQDPSKGEKKPIEIGTKMKNEEMRLRIEAIAGLKKKAEKSGMPYSILKKVYDRGMAAWKGGHRPGAGQHQWAFARVNSFVTKSSGTWGGADKDLAAKVRGSKK